VNYTYNFIGLVLNITTEADDKNTTDHVTLVFLISKLMTIKGISFKCER